MTEAVPLTAADLRPISLFDGLTETQLGELATAGVAVAIEPGVEYFREGQHADYWWVLIDGAIELIRTAGGEESVVGRMDVSGRWAGGFRAWDEHGVYLASGRGVSVGRVLRVPADVLRERTGVWFPFGGHLIAGLYRTARSIESTARQREALVTLGTLAAGLAHEINNPAAAAARAADALDEACAALLSSLRRLADGRISADQFADLDALRQQAPTVTKAVDPLAMSDLEDDLSSWLSEHGIGRDWEIAPALAAAGIDVAWADRAGQILPGPALEPGLEWVASTLSVAALLAEVKEATGRVSSLVAAVTSYSQMDRGSLQRIDVTDGIESTLVMLGHKLREGVTVERAYAPQVPMIDAYAGELNQVWTNLIDNAVDAMHGTGTLTIRVVADESRDAVVVEVGDTGEGMTASVAARAFEPFFTTKDVGKGTGLGLDIAQRIVVERHAGTITIDSRPGTTVLVVSLPVRRSRDR